MGPKRKRRPQGESLTSPATAGTPISNFFTPLAELPPEQGADSTWQVPSSLPLVSAQNEQLHRNAAQAAPTSASASGSSSPARGSSRDVPSAAPLPYNELPLSTVGGIAKQCICPEELALSPHDRHRKLPPQPDVAAYTVGSRQRSPIKLPVNPSPMVQRDQNERPGVASGSLVSPPPPLHHHSPLAPQSKSVPPSNC